MRRALLVRRRRFSGVLFFTALSWVGIGMGFDMKSGLIEKDFRTFLEAKLDKAFAGKEVRLSRIEGGIFRPLAIDDFNVSKRLSTEGAQPLPVFRVDRIIIKYNLVNLLRRQFDQLGGVYLISPSLYFASTQTPGYASGASQGTGSSIVASSVSATVPIRFHILNGTIIGFGKEPILANLKGLVTFCNSTLVFNNLKGTFLNLPVLVNGRIDKPFEDPVVKLRLLIRDKYYTARIALKSAGQKNGVILYGNLRFFDRFNVPLKGKINISTAGVIKVKDLAIGDLVNISGDINLAAKSSKFIIRPKTGSIKVIGNISEEKGLSAYAKLSHLNIFGFDVLSQVDINTRLYKTDGPAEIFRGLISTQNLILNYRPFKEIKARWLLKKNELFISGIEIGDDYRLSGTLNLNPPHKMDLTLTINQAFISDWLIVPSYDRSEILSGVLNGKLKIGGTLKKPITKGQFSVRDGNIKDIRFNSLNLNLNGKGPVLTVYDSKIVKEDGFLFIDGEIDLRKFGRRNLFEDLKVETDQRVIVWEGWDISKDIDTSEVRLKKDINEDFRVNFKTYSNEKGFFDQNRDESELGVDYKIKKNDSVNIKMKENSAFVGVEHKIKF